MRKQSVTFKKTHKFRPGPAHSRSDGGIWPVLLATLLLLALPCGHVTAQSSIKPVSELARLSLLEGASETGQPEAIALWAGLEFRLATHVKTYWRTVGDSGLPPVFSWTGSRNLQSVEVLWPVPSRFQDKSGSSIGYHDHLVLPFKVTPLDPKQPVYLKLSLDYAVCDILCMPAHFDGVVTLSPRSTRSTASQTLIREALAKVPLPVMIQAQSPLALLSISAQDTHLLLESVWPAHTGNADLFVEGPEGWVFGPPVPLSDTVETTGRRIRRDRISIDEKPQADSLMAGLAMIVTLATGDMAVETRVTLDKQGHAP